MTTDDETNKASGDQMTINTGGGDHAGHDIDKRQGKVFVEGSTIYGNVIGEQNIQLPPPPPALHQLRAPVSDFVGREHEIDQLVQTLSKVASGGAAAAISGVRGMGGIGKTELAHVVAHRLKDTFPDAQLLVELRGASSSPMMPEVALQQVIRSFEREAKLPGDLGQLQGIYRSVLTGKRVLIFADDAKDGGQVRPLLPSPGCALLVTSRNRFVLPGIVAIDLGTLPPLDAEALLLEICPRIGDHAKEMAKLCGYLPLALRVSASLLEANDTRDVGRYIEQLHTEQLKHLSDPDRSDDPQASVEASLRSSYDTLEPAAQSALCQISVFPTSFDLEATKAIVVIEADVIEVLELLRRRSLLEWDTELERYSLHDLVRAFAAARLADADAIQLRYARHYAQVTGRADALYAQGREAVLAGLALFDQEHVHLDTAWAWASERSGERDADELLVAFATARVATLRQARRRERISKLETALVAAQRLGKQGVESQLLNSLGLAYVDVGEMRRAIDCFEEALTVARACGDRRREGKTTNYLGSAHRLLGDTQKAIGFHEHALAIARELGDQQSQKSVLTNLADAYLLTDAQTAIAFAEQALTIARELGDRWSEAGCLHNLGNAYKALGELHQAIACYEQSLSLKRDLGDRWGEARTLHNLGYAFDALGDSHKAIAYYEQSLPLKRDLGDRWGEARTLYSLADAHRTLEDNHRAIQYYEQVVQIWHAVGARHREGDTLNNLGNAYLDVGDTPRAIACYQQSLTLKRNLGNRRGEGRTLKNLGNAYEIVGDVQKAVAYYEEAVQLFHELNDDQEEVRTRWHLGHILEQLGDRARAVELMQGWVDYARSSNNPDAEKDAVEVEQLRQRLAASQGTTPTENPDEG